MLSGYNFGVKSTELPLFVLLTPILFLSGNCLGCLLGFLGLLFFKLLLISKEGLIVLFCLAGGLFKGLAFAFSLLCLAFRLLSRSFFSIPLVEFCPSRLLCFLTSLAFCFQGSLLFGFQTLLFLLLPCLFRFGFRLGLCLKFLRSQYGEAICNLKTVGNREGINSH